MMKTLKNVVVKLLTIALLFSFPSVLMAIDLKTSKTIVSIDNKGFYSSIKVAGKEILSAGNYPMISTSRDGKIILPKSLEVNGSRFSLSMEDGNKIVVHVTQSPNAIVYEIKEINDGYREIVFGPLKVNMHEVVGEVVGVAQHADIAFGMQSLHIKTNGGIPYEVADTYSKFFNYTGENAELSVSSTPFYNLAAVDTKDGTVFQLSSRNRERVEYRKVQQIDKSLTLPVEGPDAKIVGSKIALFGDQRAEILNRIGKVEIEQKLPHPMINGEWDKTSRSSMRSYLISSFSEKDIDFVLDKAKRAGFKNIYHEGPFDTWGHFKWSPSFVVDGDEGVKRIVEKINRQGIDLGVHTLSNFLTPNDSYVTPVPSKHLLKQGELTLLSDLDDKQTTVEIAKSALFEMPLTLNALQIGDELITFGKVDVAGDRMSLTGCTRGAFRTQKSTHKKSEMLYKLWDYPYKTLFPDLKLQDEFAARLSEIFNKTGIKQISFDGLEGCMYTGHDYYATARFVKGFYDQVKDKSNIINDASRLDHYSWHIHTRMNWGEPWGEEMRKGQVDSRIKNQKYFTRNLFPRMLGWFLVRLGDRKFETTSLEDLEWALSESAGFDSGYAMSINLQTLRNHGQIDKLLEAMKNWDFLRINQAFTEEQRARLRDPETEWHLEKKGENDFLLHPLYISKQFRCDLSEMQPGQPGGADWSWSTPTEGSFALRIKVEGEGAIANPSFTTPAGVIKIEGKIKANQYLLLDHEGHAVLTDKNYNTIDTLTIQGKALLPAGSSAVAFACDVEKDSSPEVVVRYITRAKAEPVKKVQTKKN